MSSASVFSELAFGCSRLVRQRETRLQSFELLFRAQLFSLLLPLLSSPPMYRRPWYLNLSVYFQAPDGSKMRVRI